jgi:hypothetical protein
VIYFFINNKIMGQPTILYLLFAAVTFVTLFYILHDHLETRGVAVAVNKQAGEVNEQAVEVRNNPLEAAAKMLNNAPHLHFEPKICPNATMFGREHKGGWFVCGDTSLQPVSASEKCIVYSYGLGADWSFDDAAEKHGCEVHGFDPSGLLWRQGMHGNDYSGIDYAKQYPSKLKSFHNWGIGVLSKALYPIGTVPQDWPGLGDPQLSKSNSEPWELRSVEQAMIDLNHLDSKPPISVLKIDTEGSEWDALVAFFNSEKILKAISNGKVSQLLVEFHWDPDSKAKNKRHGDLLHKIEALGFKPWHISRHEGSDCCLDVSYLWKPLVAV